jgi:hypothetical protein
MTVHSGDCCEEAIVPLGRYGTVETHHNECETGVLSSTLPQEGILVPYHSIKVGQYHFLRTPYQFAACNHHYRSHPSLSL